MGKPFNIGHSYHVTKKKHTSPFFNLDRDFRGVLDQSQIGQYGLQQPWREPGRGWVGQHGLEVRQGHQLDAGQFGEVRVRQDNVHHQVEVDGHFVGGEHLHKRPEEVFTTAITKKTFHTRDFDSWNVR